MKIVLMTACAVMVGASASASTLSNYANAFSSYVAFGDSLTDDGKFAGTPFEPGPPSDGGRFSNGITYAEHIAQDFSASRKFSANLAIGGATARNENENSLPPAFGTFGGQVATFGGLVADPGAAAAVGDRPLFSVLFGGNDVLQNVGLPDAGSPPPGNILPGVGSLAADAVEANIRSINSLNSNYNDFLVLNLGDVSQTPLFSNPFFGAGASAPLAASETAGYNDKLAMNIDSLRSDGINIIEFDLNAFNESLLANSALAGIDIDNPCTFSLSNIDPANTCVFSPGAPNDIDLSLADAFFFIDGVHPNRVAQKAVADEVRAALSVSAVPLPAGLPLLLVGLGAFGFVRRRRAA